MSVVAVKNNKDCIEIAADSITVYGWGTQDKDKKAKLFNIKKTGIVLGGAGAASTITLLAEYLTNHTPKTNNEYGWINLFSDFVAWAKNIANIDPSNSVFVVVYEGKIFLIEDFFVKKIEKFTAIGAGMDYALASLHLGKTAKEAVAIACELSIYCEKPINTIIIQKNASRRTSKDTRAPAPVPTVHSPGTKGRGSDSEVAQAVSKGGAKKRAVTKKVGWRLLPQFHRDMHPGRFVEAICPHGVGHHKGVHGCDGCCESAPEEIWSEVSKD